MLPVCGTRETSKLMKDWARAKCYKKANDLNKTFGLDIVNKHHQEVQQN